MAQNDMHAAVCFNEVGELTNLEGEGGLLKSLLHLAFFKHAQVAISLGA